MRFFNEITHTVVDVGSLEAELCKLIDNTFRDTVFAYANQMALLTEKLGLNFSDLVAKLIWVMKEIKFLIPTWSWGPCLSKDPYILRIFSKFNLDCSVTSSARRIKKLLQS